MDLSLPLLYGILAMLGYGAASSLQKAPTKAMGAPAMIFYRNIVIVAIYIPILILTATRFLDAPQLIFALAISAFGYIPYYLFSLALKGEKVGIIVPLSSSSAIIALILSSAFYREILSPLQILAIIAVFAGVFMITFHKSRIRLPILSKPVLLASAAAILWGFFYFATKPPIDSLGPIAFAFILEGTVLLCAFVHGLWESGKLPKAPGKSSIRALIAAGAAASVGTMALAGGISVSGVGLISAIASARPLVSALHAHFAYGERLGKGQWAGIGLTILALAAINLG